MDQPLRALGWMVLSALGFSVMSVFTKTLGAELPHFELVFFRSFVNFVFVIPIVIQRVATKREVLVPMRWVPLLTFRGLMGFGGLSCFFYTIIHLPLSIAAMLNWSSPLLVFLGSSLWLGERFTFKLFFVLLLTFAGLGLLLRPDLVAGSVALPLVPFLVGVIGAGFSSLAYITVRAATAHVSVHMIILFWTGVASLISLPLALRDFQTPNGQQALGLLAMGLCASFGQYAMTNGYRYAAAGVVSTMNLMTAGFAAIWGWWFFSERLAPGQWMGMIFLAGGIALITWVSSRQPTPRSL